MYHMNATATIEPRYIAPRKRVLNGVSIQGQMVFASSGAKNNPPPAASSTNTSTSVNHRSSALIGGFTVCEFISHSEAWSNRTRDNSIDPPTPPPGWHPSPGIYPSHLRLSA